MSKQALSERIAIRISDKEKEYYRKAAEKDGYVELSAWIRFLMRKAAGEPK